MSIFNSFGSAPIKAEGQTVDYGVSLHSAAHPRDVNPDSLEQTEIDLPEVDTTYVERRVPIALEDEAHELIDNWLKSKGYDPEEL